MSSSLRICCLDLEGVLLPEIWINVSRRTGVQALKLTTRDIPDYDRLMRYRLKILKKEGIRLRDIQKVIASMKPLPGAKSFLKQLQQHCPVVILSDTFYEFAGPLMRQLEDPTLLCHNLKVGKSGFITGYTLRQRDSKRRAVQALRQLNFRVVATGDSYNDLSMLKAAHRGVLFNPPDAIRKKYPGFPVARDYRALLKYLTTL